MERIVLAWRLKKTIGPVSTAYAKLATSARRPSLVSKQAYADFDDELRRAALERQVWHHLHDCRRELRGKLFFDSEVHVNDVFVEPDFDDDMRLALSGDEHVVRAANMHEQA
eukprot:2654046-Pleurochrysis_carterae.AAC.1